jgi:hypothetical protein
MARAAYEPVCVTKPTDFWFEQETGMGDESLSLKQRHDELLEHYYAPLSRLWGNPQIRFVILKAQWESETRYLSSISEICLNTNYQQIIGMGPIAIPYIMAEMRSRPGHWFWALRSITGEDPVLPQERGRIKSMTNRWLQWGKEQGYL